MAKAKKSTPGSIRNRRASFDYALQDSYTTGIVLTGPEVKSVRLGRANLRGAYVQILNGELWLINATISPVPGNAAYLTETMQTQNRKLLVKSRELDALIKAKQQGLAIVPLTLHTTGRYIKLTIAVGAGKKRYDKRQTIKQRDTNRDTHRLLAKH